MYHINNNNLYHSNNNKAPNTCEHTIPFAKGWIQWKRKSRKHKLLANCDTKCEFCEPIELKL